MAKLAAGYNITIKKRVGSVNTPLYPFTAVENVFDKDGNSLATLLSGITGQNFVPDYSGETTSSLRFLRNDNTWADIQSASTSQAGVVQLSNKYVLGQDETASQTLAATEKAVIDATASLQNQIDSLSGNLSDYVPTTALGVTVAELDSNGKVPSSQLPSFVDDVIEGYLKAADGKFYEEDTYTTEITAESGKIYVDLATKKCYRWGGSAYAEISESLAIGTTQGTAYDGAAGQALATKLAGISEGATKVEASATNGNIKIDNVETTVFTLDASSIKTTLGAASTSNDGYMTSTMFDKLDGISAGATKVEASTINGNIKIDSVETTVFTPDNASTTTAGYMSAADYTKLQNCQQIAVGASAPSWTDGIWYEEVSAYAPNPDEP